jgi:3-deoxy-D-manno-octulosonate 8-phosphate phosphatase (KDO 8-P phosphatase)
VKIKAIFMDVDGVLTDGKIHVGSDGRELFKTFHAHDAAGIIKAKEMGILISWISAKKSEITRARAGSLDIDEVYFTSDKEKPVRDVCSKYRISLSNCCYIGDDELDIPPMSVVGLPIAVSNATDTVKEIASYVTPSRGGEGAVREAIEYAMRFFEGVV